MMTRKMTIKKHEGPLPEAGAKGPEAAGLAGVNERGARLWRIADLQAGLDEVLSVTMELMGVEKGNLQLFDPIRGVLTIVAQRGFDKRFLDFFREVPAGTHSACAEALRLRQPVAVADVATDPRFVALRAAARAAGFRAVVSWPLIGGDGAPLGVVSTHFGSVHRSSKQEMHLPELYAQQAALFIQRRRTERIRRLAAIVESSEEAIISKDLNGIITSWNAGAERIFGYTAREAVGQPITLIIPPERHRDEEEILQRLRAGERIGPQETVRQHKSGARLEVVLTISPVRDAAGRILGASTIAHEITRMRAARQAASEREFSAHALQLQDGERRRIARELHDSVGQLLVGIRMNLSLLADEGQLSPTGTEYLQKNIALVQEAAREIRTISYLLHPPFVEEFGLEGALKIYVEGFSERSQIPVELELSEGLGQLPEEVELAVFRIVQECLTNVHRHSGSATARVRLHRANGGIELEVRDKGRGIAPELRMKFASGEGGGIGLRGMRERVRLAGGTLEIRSGESGTAVVATLPLTAPAAVTAASEANST